MNSAVASKQTFAGPTLPKKGYVAAILVAVLTIACVYWQSPNFRPRDSATASPYAGDFMQEWLGGYIVREGDHRRFYEPAYAQQLQHERELIGFQWDEGRYLPIVYPPFYYALVSPLSLLRVSTAAWLWAGLMLTCFSAAMMLLIRAAVRSKGVFALERRDNAEQSAKRRRLWAALLPWSLPAAVLFAPMLENITSSQKGAVCLLILTATFLLLDSKRPFWAGVVFAALAFKPQLTLVIALAMLLTGRWRFVIGGLVATALLVGASLLVGIDVCRQYVQFSMGTADYMQTAGYDLHKSHCLYGFFTLLAGGQATLPVYVATLISAGVVMGLLWRLLRGGLTPGRSTPAIQFSGLVIATLLLSPHLFTYDLTILVLPIFLLTYLLVCGMVSSTTRRPLAWLLLAIYALAGVSPAIALQTGVQITTPLMMALLVVLVWEVRAAPASRTATAQPPSDPQTLEDPQTLGDPPALGDHSLASGGLRI